MSTSVRNRPASSPSAAGTGSTAPGTSQDRPVASTTGTAKVPASASATTASGTKTFEFDDGPAPAPIDKTAEIRDLNEKLAEAKRSLQETKESLVEERQNVEMVHRMEEYTRDHVAGAARRVQAEIEQAAAGTGGHTSSHFDSGSVLGMPPLGEAVTVSYEALPKGKSAAPTLGPTTSTGGSTTATATKATTTGTTTTATTTTSSSTTAAAKQTATVGGGRGQNPASADAPPMVVAGSTRTSTASREKTVITAVNVDRPAPFLEETTVSTGPILARSSGDSAHSAASLREQAALNNSRVKSSERTVRLATPTLAEPTLSQRVGPLVFAAPFFLFLALHMSQNPDLAPSLAAYFP